MTYQRARAKEDTCSPEPVNNWQNANVKGQALCSDNAYRTQVDRAMALRGQQNAYLESLPSEPTEVITASFEKMCPNGESYPEGIEEALHLSIALEAIIQVGDTDYECRSRDAALFIANRLGSSIGRAAKQLDMVADVLNNPSRIEREKKLKGSKNQE